MRGSSIAGLPLPPWSPSISRGVLAGVISSSAYTHRLSASPRKSVSDPQKRDGSIDAHQLPPRAEVQLSRIALGGECVIRVSSGSLPLTRSSFDGPTCSPDDHRYQPMPRVLSNTTCCS
ncbi:hypothetical protein FPZ24_00070 [Sphingomonas panacisoli]|uniref:Uncharacterized protein n=1 Tax=Sphingomonas panacisoli TaxID=1813879 RepID=A0A5B8LE76_9SPHN|nr:hypothetical protein [Sphingomonas panacisoli]QDZ06065.1 hypothetical protein FPZ24_00070 [Sphingomonas panacisoli]